MQSLSMPFLKEVGGIGINDVVSIEGYADRRFKIAFTLSTGVVHTIVIDHPNEKLTFKKDGCVENFFFIRKNTFDYIVILEVFARKNGQSVVFVNQYRYNVTWNIQNLKEVKIKHMAALEGFEVFHRFGKRRTLK